MVFQRERNWMKSGKNSWSLWDGNEGRHLGFNQRPVGIACFLMAIGKGKDGISRFPLGRWNDIGTQKSDVFDMVKTCQNHFDSC